MKLHRWMGIFGVLCACLLAACAPTPQGNVIGYLVEQRLGGPVTVTAGETATLTGQVWAEGRPLAGAWVLVAERTGTPHAAQSDAQGRYRIEGIPPGQYVPAAVAPYHDEVALTGALGLPWLLTLPAGETVEAPPLHLTLHQAAPLPNPLPQAVNLQMTRAFTATAPFPEGAAAKAWAFQFERAGVVVDSLRVYQPLDRPPRQDRFLFAVFPGVIEGWEPASVAFATAGYTLVAISPAGARGVDVDAHTEDARVALALARGGHLGVEVGDAPAVALGGSFSSAILHRLLRDERQQFAAWVTVGGISNAFTGSADFYAGRLEIPEQYRFVIPAMGPANIYPLPFLRYSPVYTAAQLPPTLIIHTDADHIIPISQAYELETALRQAGVPVDVFYYQDVSHYLQIGENLTEAGKDMYWRVLRFVGG